jgi:RNA polymerase subunit RPABC4/transcription elongation factor Spt4
MDDKESEGVYDYYCVDCKSIVNPRDKVCANCGADISEFIEENEVIQKEKNSPACPLCKGRSFQREEGRLDSMWGFSSHVMILLICEQCQYVLQFYDGNSIWDFD